jgi:hypothetical protein
MWEVRAAAGRIEELLAYVTANADPAADVYRSVDGRVVVIDPTGRGVPGTPADLLERPPHEWTFEEVPRSR